MSHTVKRAGFLLAALKATIGVVILVLLFAKVEWRLLYESMANIRLEYVILALGCFILVILSESIRLMSVFRQYSLGFLSSLRMNVIGSVFGVLTPAQVGSDIYKVYAIRDSQYGLIQPAMLIIFVRLTGLLVLLLSLSLALYMNRGEIEELLLLYTSGKELAAQYNIIIYSLVMLLIIMTVFLFIRKSGSGKMNERIDTVLKAFDKARNCLSWKVILSVLILSFVIMLLRVAMIDSLIAAVGYDLKVGSVLLVVSLAMISMMLPISISGVGVREGVIVLLLVAFLVPYEEAAIVALASRVFLLIMALSGVVWMYRSGRNSGYANNTGM